LCRGLCHDSLKIGRGS